MFDHLTPLSTIDLVLAIVIGLAIGLIAMAISQWVDMRRQRAEMRAKRNELLELRQARQKLERAVAYMKEIQMP